MSELGQKRKLARLTGMSRSTPKADITLRTRHVRSCPTRHWLAKFTDGHSHSLPPPKRKLSTSQKSLIVALTRRRVVGRN